MDREVVTAFGVTPADLAVIKLWSGLEALQLDSKARTAISFRTLVREDDDERRKEEAADLNKKKISFCHLLAMLGVGVRIDWR